MFAVSIVYVLGHNRVAPAPQSGNYVVHFSSAIFGVFAKYWEWSVGPLRLSTPLHMRPWVVPAGVAVLSLALLVFAALKLRAQGWAAGFFLAWYVITLTPLLPFSDHLTDYYIYIPVIGLCWLGGWAFVEAWSPLPAERGARAKVIPSSQWKMLAGVLALLYVFLALTTRWRGIELPADASRARSGGGGGPGARVAPR